MKVVKQSSEHVTLSTTNSFIIIANNRLVGISHGRKGVLGGGMGQRLSNTVQ